MTVAMVLSGGANLGSAQVGMMQAVAASGVRPDLIIGSSVGAVNGAWLASGRDLAGLARIWRGLRRGDVFPVSPVSTALGFLGHADHLISNRRLRRLLEQNVTFGRLEDAEVPLHVIATDVLTGDDVKLSTGPAVDAILASSAIPGIFPPIHLGDRLLMDGGVVNNTPISHAAALGADTVWVLATGYHCALREGPRSPLALALHAFNLATHDRLARDIDEYAETVDLRVVPPLCPLDLGLADFSKGSELIERARGHTEQWLQATSAGRNAVADGSTVFAHDH
ncbi:MAG TPA: patatin-like phospholipase family protein [Aeromicrobium sp.]|nr:patatin-like phospholipase family protein [Aeromicrobium sp.]